MSRGDSAGGRRPYATRCGAPIPRARRERGERPRAMLPLWLGDVSRVTAHVRAPRQRRAWARAADGPCCSAAQAPAESTSTTTVYSYLPAQSISTTDACTCAPLADKGKITGGRRVRLASCARGTTGGDPTRLRRDRVGSLRERADSARLIKQSSQRTGFIRLVCELELTCLAREPQRKNSIYVYIQQYD